MYINYIENVLVEMCLKKVVNPSLKMVSISYKALKRLPFVTTLCLFIT